MKNDQLYISNIKEAIHWIETYTDTGEQSFLTTKMIQDAVIRNLEIIGEATKNLSPEFRQQNPQIPWRQMAGLRDVLIHDYLRIDLEEIWLIVKNDLPALKQNLKNL
jgi:uncharacterized protein with HEPN domain